MNVLPRHFDFLELVVAERCQAAEDERHEFLGSRRAGGKADGLVPGEQVGIETTLAVDEQRLGAFTLRDLDEPPRAIALTASCRFCVA